MRLGLAEFSDKVRNYVDDFIATQAILLSFKTIFNSKDIVWQSNGEYVIKCLSCLSEQNYMIYTFIKHSNHLPLAVVPLRLPLIMALQDADEQIATLKRLLIEFRSQGWATLNQSVEMFLAIKMELDILLLKSDKVLDEIGILLDRAKFKEREYSIA